ncbi:MAG: hypothetical protein ABR924_03745 [Terracidiphilus sp.]
MAVQKVAGDSQNKRRQLCDFAKLPAPQCADGFNHHILLQIGGQVGIAGSGQQHSLDPGKILPDKYLLGFPVSRGDGQYQPLPFQGLLDRQFAGFRALLVPHPAALDPIAYHSFLPHCRHGSIV